MMPFKAPRIALVTPSVALDAFNDIESDANGSGSSSNWG